MICFVGSSFAPKVFRRAALIKGIKLTDDPSLAELVFVSEDTPTDAEGNRDLGVIRTLVRHIFGKTMAPIVLTSQTPPGFVRSLELPIWCQAETLRIKDALERALRPEQHIIGCEDPNAPLPKALITYFDSFPAPIFQMSYESCEFSKIAINMTLASQVDNANRLSKAAEAFKADWDDIEIVLSHDGRIGPKSYLTPGDWKKSPHLLRDYATLRSLDGRLSD